MAPKHPATALLEKPVSNFKRRKTAPAMALKDAATALPEESVSNFKGPKTPSKMAVKDAATVQPEESLPDVEDPKTAHKALQDYKKWIANQVFKKMMYVSGETGEPSPETTGMVEEIVRQQVIEMVCIIS